MPEQIPLTSNVRPRDSMTQPFRIVLHKAHNYDWVVHHENVIENEHGGYQSKKDKEFYWGHYFKQDYNKAVADYHETCKKYGL